MLLKAIDQSRIAGLFDEAGTLNRFETLQSLPPTDFSGTQSLFYFTPDHRVAVYYAAYAKRRTNCVSVVIVCLRIPNAAIESRCRTDLDGPLPHWLRRAAAALAQTGRCRRRATAALA